MPDYTEQLAALQAELKRNNRNQDIVSQQVDDATQAVKDKEDGRPSSDDAEREFEQATETLELLCLQAEQLKRDIARLTKLQARK